jgi:hypothetical protein
MYLHTIAFNNIFTTKEHHQLITSKKEVEIAAAKGT